MAHRNRITRREIKQDRFILFLYEAGDLITRHAKEILIGLAVIVFAAAAGYWYASMQQSKNLDAARLLAPALSAAQQERYDDAAPIFERVRQEFASTSSAAEATIGLADAYFRLGKTDTALTMYQDYLDEYNENNILAISAEAGIAACLEQQGKYQEAAERFQKLAEKQTDSYVAPRFLLDSGRCYLAAKQTDRAKAMYDKVVTAYEKSRYVRDAKIALATL